VTGKTVLNLFLACILSVCVFTSCGQKEVVFDDVIEMPWGQVSMPTRWRVENKDGNSVTLSSLEEEKLEVTINSSEIPSNFETWANSHAVKSGRMPTGKGKQTVDGQDVEYLTTVSTVGKIEVTEKLFILEVDDDNGLAVIMTHPSSSKMVYQAEAVVDSIRIER